MQLLLILSKLFVPYFLFKINIFKEKIYQKASTRMLFIYISSLYNFANNKIN